MRLCDLSVLTEVGRVNVVTPIEGRGPSEVNAFQLLWAKRQVVVRWSAVTGE